MIPNPLYHSSNAGGAAPLYATGAGNPGRDLESASLPLAFEIPYDDPNVVNNSSNNNNNNNNNNNSNNNIIINSNINDNNGDSRFYAQPHFVAPTNSRPQTVFYQSDASDVIEFNALMSALDGIKNDNDDDYNADDDDDDDGAERPYNTIEDENYYEKADDRGAISSNSVSYPNYEVPNERYKEDGINNDGATGRQARAYAIVGSNRFSIVDDDCDDENVVDSEPSPYNTLARDGTRAVFSSGGYDTLGQSGFMKAAVG